MRLLPLVVALVSSQASAADVTGKWEVQSMGGDREIAVRQKGEKIVGHRVMWPVFDGEKYKFEHLYRGAHQRQQNQRRAPR